MEIIKIRNLFKNYYLTALPLEVLKGINLDIHKSEIIAIVGESGCGKSTLLNLIGGLDSIHRGRIMIANKSISDMSEDELSSFRNSNIGFVFQFHYLLPDFTALENVMLPYLANKFKLKSAKEKAMALLKEVKLENRANHKPNELSGGEQQRVAVARALINDPMIMLADEPTGNLDEKTTQEIQSLLWDIREYHKITIVLVTHNADISNKADRKVRLAYGKIQEINKYGGI